MSDFWLYFTLGYQHVLGVGAYDHLLFLAVLSVSYGFSQWRRWSLLVSLFTLGHSISLAATHFFGLEANERIVEFLIPCTIIATAVYNIVQVLTKTRRDSVSFLGSLAFLFGLIHRLGFGRYFGLIEDQGSVIALIDFALGIEWAQLIIVFVVLVLSFVVERGFGVKKRDWVIAASVATIAATLPILLGQ